MLPEAEGVAGMRVLELRHRADVSRAEPLDFHPLLPLLDRQVVELLRRLVLRIPDFVPVLELAPVQAEERHVAHVRLGDRLEHPADERRVHRRRHFGRRRE
jgi:hypothetical protein